METKQQGSSAKNWLVSSVLTWNLILTMILGMGMIPKKEELILKLEKRIYTAEKRLKSVLFGKEEAEKKVKILEKENILLKNTPKGKVVKPEPEVIRIERKLTHYDSLTIATVMMGEVMRPEDSLVIYYQVESKMIHNLKSGMRPGKR